MSDSELETTFIEPTQLKNLIKKRGTVKCKLTLFSKFLEKFSNQQLSGEEILDLELRLARIEQVLDEFEKVQDTIETVSTDVEAQMSEREVFENTYFQLLSKAKALLKVNTSTDQPTPLRDTGPTQAAHSVESIKFPDIALPSFDGNIINWIEFRDTFDALVNQSSLRPIQRFKYLKSCLRGSAVEVISSLEYSEESYPIAWQLLCERYNNPRVLVYNHLRALLNIDVIPFTPPALRMLTDNLSKHLRTLLSLNIQTEGWDILLIFLLCSKLDITLQRKWEEKNCSRELPSLQDFKNFLRTQADLLETLAHSSMVEHRPPGGTRKAMVITSSPSQPKVIPNQFNNQRNQCLNCGESHYINQCNRLLTLNPVARIRVIKRLGLCLNCMGSNHILPNCRSSNCRLCKGKHHTLLHIPTDTKPNSKFSVSAQSTLHANEPMPSTSSTSKSFNLLTNQGTTSPSEVKVTHQKHVILSTAQIRVIDHSNQAHIMRALLDSGSQSNFIIITENAFNQLNMTSRTVDLEVLGFNEQVTKLNKICQLNIQSKNGSFATNVSCFIVPIICNSPNHMNGIHFKIPKRFQLADDKFYEGGEIDLILGADLFYELLCNGRYRLGAALPVLQKTQLGWLVTGTYSITAPTPQKVRCKFAQTKALQAFWNADECHLPSTIPHDELTLCEKVFSEHKRTADGNFVVGIPLTEPVTSLGQSRSIVLKRFRALESKFTKDLLYKKNYVKFMNDLKSSGHMIEHKGSTGCCNYLPHHAVLTPQKQTTPLRVVIDASFKTSTGKSLNDIQPKGTINQDDLFDILLRFRKNRFVINADIEKMYRMIYINPKQQNLQCILWRENPTEPLLTYRLTTLSFGLKCAPCIATRCLQQLSQEHQTQHPEAAAAISTNFYMDDLLHGGDDEQQVAATALQIEKILYKANFNLRKWKSNSPIIQGIVSKSYTTNTNLTPTPLGQDKVLGLAWDNTTDNLMYQLKRQAVQRPLTKRKVLSLASSIFDPLGLLAPVLIISKCFIQKL